MALTALQSSLVILDRRRRTEPRSSLRHLFPAAPNVLGKVLELWQPVLQVPDARGVVCVDGGCKGDLLVPGAANDARTHLGFRVCFFRLGSKRIRSDLGNGGALGSVDVFWGSF
jgi:hypothetical protein